MTIDPTTLKAPVSSGAPRPSRRRLSVRLPLTIRYVLPLAVVVGIVWSAWGAFEAGRARLQLVDKDGNPIATAATVEFFVHDPRPSAPSPTPSIGRRELDETGRLTVGRDLIGDAALVRLEVPGHGIAYGFAELGADLCDLVIGEPGTVRGVVVGDVDGKAVAGAVVQAFGGGPRGVLLSETTTDATGGFGFDGVSDSVRDWTFRVFADEYAVGEHDWLSSPDQTVWIELRRTRPARGRLVVSPEGGTEAPGLGDLELRIYKLPGVSARTAADGSFSIAHLPPSPTHGFLLVPELPAGWTYRRTAVEAGGDPTEVKIVPARTLRGRVVNGHSGLGVAAASVHHDHGPDGIEIAVTGSDGGFVLRRVPLGPVTVTAHLLVNRVTIPVEARKEKSRTARVLIQGSESVLVLPDQPPAELSITVW